MYAPNVTNVQTGKKASPVHKFIALGLAGFNILLCLISFISMGQSLPDTYDASEPFMAHYYGTTPRIAKTSFRLSRHLARSRSSRDNGEAVGYTFSGIFCIVAIVFTSVALLTSLRFISDRSEYNVHRVTKQLAGFQLAAFICTNAAIAIFYGIRTHGRVDATDYIFGKFDTYLCLIYIISAFVHSCVWKPSHDSDTNVTIIQQPMGGMMAPMQQPMGGYAAPAPYGQPMAGQPMGGYYNQQPQMGYQPQPAAGQMDPNAQMGQPAQAYGTHNSQNAQPTGYENTYESAIPVQGQPSTAL